MKAILIYDGNTDNFFLMFDNNSNSAIEAISQMPGIALGDLRLIAESEEHGNEGKTPRLLGRSLGNPPVAHCSNWGVHIPANPRLPILTPAQAS